MSVGLVGDGYAVGTAAAELLGEAKGAVSGDCEGVIVIIVEC